MHVYFNHSPGFFKFYLHHSLTQTHHPFTHSIPHSITDENSFKEVDTKKNPEKKIFPAPGILSSEEFTTKEQNHRIPVICQGFVLFEPSHRKNAAYQYRKGRFGGLFESLLKLE